MRLRDDLRVILKQTGITALYVTHDQAEAMALAVGSIAYFGTYTVDEPSKTILLKIEASTLPNQLGFEGKRVITTLNANELRFTNTTAVGDLGPVVTSHRRAK